MHVKYCMVNTVCNYILLMLFVFVFVLFEQLLAVKCYFYRGTGTFLYLNLIC